MTKRAERELSGRGLESTFACRSPEFSVLDKSPFFTCYKWRKNYLKKPARPGGWSPVARPFELRGAVVGVTHSVLYLAVGVRLPTRAETLRHEISRERGVMVQLKLADLFSSSHIWTITNQPWGINRAEEDRGETGCKKCMGKTPGIREYVTY